MTWSKKATFPTTEFGEMKWEDFSGGKNTRFPSTQIERNQAQDCLNVYSDLRKALVKRPGFTSFATDTNGVINTFWLYYKLAADGSFTRYLLEAAGTVVRAFDGTTTTTVATALTSGLRFGYAEANNKAYFANGTDGLKQWDGTTLTAIAGAPTGTWYLVWHRNRMYALTGKNSRLYFSDLGDPTSWPVLNFLDFDVDDGDKLTGMISIDDGGLVLFKERSRHMLKGSGPGNYTSLSIRDDVGCVSHWAIAHVTDMNQVAFLDRSGVYLTNGVSKHLISDAITPDVRAWPQATLTKADMCYFNEHLHLALPNTFGDTANTYLWVWDVRGKGWWPWTIAASHLLVHFDGANRYLLASSTTTGQLNKLWTGYNDAGAAINAYWKGKDDDAGEPTRRKRYKRGFATEKAYEGTHSVTVVWNQDFGAKSVSMSVPVNAGTFPVFDVSAFDVATFVSSQGVVPKAEMVSTESGYIRPEVSQNGIDTPFAILNLTLESKLTNRRVGT
jgi:hypothetical protein